MKRQLLGSQYGFTLFELMIVITIFIAFIGATNIFTTSPQTDVEKADRMKAVVSDMFRSEIQNISIGHMPKRDGKIASSIEIALSTGALLTKYLTGGTQLYSSNFASPFFDQDIKYEIKTLSWTGSPNTVDGWTGASTVIIGANGITFSGTNGAPAGIGNNPVLEIKVGYQTRARKVIIDRRTGKISEMKFY